MQNFRDLFRTDTMHKLFYSFTAALCIIIFAATALATESNTVNSPSAFFPEARFEFKPVVAGVNVTHPFIVKNNGAKRLQIESVKAG